MASPSDLGSLELESYLLTTVLAIVGGFLGCMLMVLCLGLCLCVRKARLDKEGTADEFSPMKSSPQEEDAGQQHGDADDHDGWRRQRMPAPDDGDDEGDHHGGTTRSPPKAQYNERLARARNSARIARVRDSVQLRLSSCASGATAASAALGSCAQSRLPPATPPALGRRSRVPAPSPIEDPSPYKELAPEVPEDDYLPEPESPVAVGDGERDGTIDMSIEDDELDAVEVDGNEDV